MRHSGLHLPLKEVHYACQVFRPEGVATGLAADRALKAVAAKASVARVTWGFRSFLGSGDAAGEGEDGGFAGLADAT